MNTRKLTRTLTGLIAGTALFAAGSRGANAVPSTFNVSTTITAACTVTDAGPANLTPTYTSSTDSGTGSETVLNTFCNGTNPTVTFTDAEANTGNYYAMNDGNGNLLVYQISNTPTCSGVVGDVNLEEGEPYAITTAAFDICASVLVNGSNTGLPAGNYTDVVTYTITP